MKDLHTQIRRCKTGIEVEILTVEAKKLTSKERNNLPDSDSCGNMILNSESPYNCTTCYWEDGFCEYGWRRGGKIRGGR